MAVLMLPCSLLPGLKWPPALVPSGALQSPFSWMWKPCSLSGFKPVISPLARNWPSTRLKLMVPATVLSLVGCSCAVAIGLASSGGAAGSAAGVVSAVGAMLSAGTASGSAPLLQAVRARALARNRLVWISRIG